MSSDPFRLDQIQRWLQAVITHPAGAAAGIESEAARSAIEVAAGQIEQLVDRSSRRTSIERLEIYANAYYARLLECLRDEYPALAHAVGQEAFDGLAFGYLQAYPSKSYTLGELGKYFPQYLEETRPRDAAGPAGPSWPDFMIDLARLERTYSEVFDGPGMEDRETLTADQVRAISADRWLGARLVTAPCLRLLSLRFPVHEYATGVRRKEYPPIPEPEPTWLAVSRVNYVVRRWPLAPVQYELLNALSAGGTVGHSLERAATLAVEEGENVDRFAESLRAWFEEWAASGFFWAVELSG